jgi:hypothetical protein
VNKEATRRLTSFPSWDLISSSIDHSLITRRFTRQHNITMAEEHDPFAAGEEEEEGLIMAPLLIAKLQVSSSSPYST